MRTRERESKSATQQENPNTDDMEGDKNLPARACALGLEARRAAGRHSCAIKIVRTDRMGRLLG